MTTLQTTILSKPVGDEKISRGVLGYILARDRQQAYDLIITELKKSSVSQATLARRIDMDTGELSRLLSRPGNWQIDTFGTLLFGISGAGLKFSTDYPRTGSSSERDTGTLGSDQPHPAKFKVYDFTGYQQQQWPKKIAETDSKTKAGSSVEARIEGVAV